MLLEADGSNERRFCTVVCGRLQPSGAGVRLTVADGGHPPVLVVRHDGTVELIKGRGTLVGCLGDARFAAVDTVLDPGDVVLFYSDGITEARRHGGSLVGTEGLTRTLRRHAGRPTGELIAGLRRLLAEFDPPPADDVALLALGVPPRTPDGDSTTRAFPVDIS